MELEEIRMANADLTTEQVVNLVLQLPAARKRELLEALSAEGAVRRAERSEYAERELRRLCSERGLNWDTMTDAERESFADDLIHEDRPCR
jgi:Mg/Co/Ni transporter MgtE